jgi:hypothetical protein
MITQNWREFFKINFEIKKKKSIKGKNDEFNEFLMIKQKKVSELQLLTEKNVLKTF